MNIDEIKEIIYNAAMDGHLKVCEDPNVVWDRCYRG